MKLMKNNKKKKTTIIVFSVIVFIVFAFFGTLYYITSTVNDYSFAEKKWINDNASNVIDISVYNDIPVYGNNGKGVIFDLLDDFTTTYGINFNKEKLLKDYLSQDLLDLI